MTARESAILMGFPATWALPHGSRAAQKAVGNAMCVALSRNIVRAAMAVRDGDASVPVETFSAITPSPAPAMKFELSRKQYRRIRRRIDSLERVCTTRCEEILED